MANQTFRYSGTTSYASGAAAPLGIKDGTPINVTCVYDPDQVPASGPFVWLTNEGQNGSVAIVLGNWNMPANADTSGTMGWPLIQFSNQAFAGVNYMGTYAGGYQFLAQENAWSITIPGAEPPVIASGTINTAASL